MNATFTNDACPTSEDSVLAKEVRRSPASLDRVREVRSLRLRSYIFCACIVLTIIVFWALLHRILLFAATSEFSYIPLVPGITAFLIAIRRHGIFARSEPSPVIGGVMTVAGIILLATTSIASDPASRTRLLLSALGFVISWWGLFFLAYGTRAAQKALLPLCLLFFMVPGPRRGTDELIALLQHGSAALSYDLFRLIGVPAVRDGMTISLPHLTIDVAPECSGIRSTLSLLLITLAGANLYLRYAYNKFLLILFLVPLSLLKNAIRIVTLSTLAIYVDPIVLSGPLHHRGGIVFFFVAFAILVPIVFVMRR